MIAVFFYGLFMDEALLASKGVMPASVATGYVEGFALHIGARATLLAEAGSRSYGVLMYVTEDDLDALYADPSVADYVAESVGVHLADDSVVMALCYNLAADAVSGANAEYATKLLTLANELGMPASYLEQIEGIIARS
jgi:hypothetical protein